MSKRIWKIAVGAVLVVACLILIGWVLSRVLGGSRCTVSSRVRGQVATMGGKLQSFQCDQGFFPPTLQVLTDPKLPGGPYAKDAELRDSWGRPLYYHVERDEQRFVLFSLGHDGLIGGEDQDADIAYVGNRARVDDEQWWRRGANFQSPDCPKLVPPTSAMTRPPQDTATSPGACDEE
ncbi:type II secretion system protein GspG [Lysobacter capsici]|uniref:type II secretion system protein GspG n=1 Tax=Lysobacter capsici TaxID=435897 RepID=UPI00069C5C38|nr:type II secretion system protein GspG [Lysobacter capsici]